MATSRLTALRGELVTQITAQLVTDGTTDVTVTAYPPLGDYSREDRVWLEEIRGNQEPYTMGGSSGFREETLEVDLRVVAPTHGGSSEEQTAGEDRAELIFASVENCARGDITVNNTVFNIELDRFVSHIDQVDEKGPVGYIEATLIAESHL